MVELTVRGMWGPRQESLREVAERWSAFLHRLYELGPEVFTGWRQDADTEAQAAAIAVDPATLEAYLAAENPLPDQHFYGYRAAVWVGSRDCPR